MIVEWPVRVKQQFAWAIVKRWPVSPARRRSQTTGSLDGALAVTPALPGGRRGETECRIDSIAWVCIAVPSGPVMLSFRVMATLASPPTSDSVQRAGWLAGRRRWLRRGGQGTTCPHRCRRARLSWRLDVPAVGMPAPSRPCDLAPEAPAAASEGQPRQVLAARLAGRVPSHHPHAIAPPPPASPTSGAGGPAKPARSRTAHTPSTDTTPRRRGVPAGSAAGRRGRRGLRVGSKTVPPR